MDKRHSRYVLRSIAAVLVLALLAGTLFLLPTRAADTSSLGKLADSFTANTDTFKLTDESRFFIPTTTPPSDALVQIVQLAQQQFAADGYPSATPMPIVWGKADLIDDGDIVVILDPGSSVGTEGYQLQVTGHATVTAKDLRGLMYGLNGLLKHFRFGGENKIKGFTSTDAPDTVERTVSLDFARKYYSKDWICNFIRQMAWMGYNTIQLHLAEDSGIRMDIWDPAYYQGSFQPSNDFTWICGSENAYYIDIFSPGGVVQTDVHKDKYLSTAEMIEILETAKQYHIDVIPSFDSPGHMDYLSWKYEDHYLKNEDYSFYSTYYGKTYAAKDIQGVINYTGAKSANISPIRNKPYFKAVNIDNEQAKAFVMELYTDIGNFFKEYAGSTDFSICADEVVLDTSLLANGYSYQFNYGDFVNYINELNAHLRGMGYTCRAYNDFIGHTAYASSYPLSKYSSDLEIMYWSSSFNSGTGGATTSKDVYYFDGTMPLYNCLSNHTYFAMAYHKSAAHPDCRCPQNTSWTMGYSTEEHIYNSWAPNDFTARGKYASSSMKVDAQYLNGAYFLIWSDNPMLSTEQQIWNGFQSCDGGHLYVDLMDRMWSSTIKMWNWDINSTVSFANFCTLRETLDDFPGLGKDANACSSAPALPKATAPVCLPDHDILAAVLANKIAPNGYTEESYAVYQAAYDAAVAVNADKHATTQEMSDVMTRLQSAADALRPLTYKITVIQKVVNTDTVLSTMEYEGRAIDAGYRLYLPGIPGYSFVSSDKGNFTPLSSKSTSGYLTGSTATDITITVEYRVSPDDSHLRTLITEAITEQGDITAASWETYSDALAAAKALLLTSPTQEQIDAAVNALEAARSALVTGTGDPQLLIQTLKDSFTAGKQIGLFITTAPTVTEVTVSHDSTPVKLTSCSGEIQTLEDGTTVKLWLVFFTAPEANTYVYTVHAGALTENIVITVT